MTTRAISDRPGEALTRRFLVLLFADIVGSTRLMSGMDPEDAYQLFSRAIAIMKADVRRYRGMVVKVPGDGVLAVFGANGASQNDALQACLAAREMHKSIEAAAANDPDLKSIALRIGIHAGNVIIHGSESDYGSALDTRGYAVNAAHKIEAACPPSETLVSDDVAALAGDWLVAEPFRAAGLSAEAASLSPRLVQSLSSDFTVESLFQKSRHALQGRAGELEMVCNALNSSSNETASVGIIGQAGIGKSRLTLEVIDRFRCNGWRILESRGLDFLSLSSYSALIPVVPGLLGLSENANAEAIEAALQDASRQHGLHVAPLLDMIGIDFFDAGYQRSDPVAKAAAISQSVVQLFELNLSTENRLLLVVEDIHLIDQRSITLLTDLQQNLSEKGFKLLASSRPEGRGILDQLGARTLSLGPLEKPDALNLVAQLWDRQTPLAPDIAEAIVERASRLPFGIVAYLRSLSGACQISIDDIPASIEASVQSQRDRLSQSALLALDYIVISGGALETAVQDKLFDRDAASALDELASCDLIVRDAEGTCSLDHDLIGDASLRFILKADREALHGRLLEALETQTEFRVPAERLARHAREAGQLIDALKYYWKACLTEIGRGSLGAIAAIYESAMDICAQIGSDADKFVADFALATFDPFHQQGLYQELEAPLTRAADIYERLGETTLRAQALGHLSIIAWIQAKHEKSLELSRRAYQACASNSSSSLSIILRYSMSSALQAIGRMSEAIEINDDLLRILDERSADGRRPPTWRPDVLTRAMNVWCLAQTGDFEKAWDQLETGKDLSDELHLPYSAIMIYAAEGLVSQACGNYARSLDAFSRAHRLCTSGDRMAMSPKTASGLGQAMTRTGDPAGAVSFIQAYLNAGWQSRGGRMNLVILHAALAEAHCALGEGNRALDNADRAVDIARANLEPPSVILALLTVGDVNLHLANAELARKSYREAEQLADEIGMRPASAHAVAGQALCDARHGRPTSETMLARALCAYDALGLGMKAEHLRQHVDSHGKPGRPPWFHDAV